MMTTFEQINSSSKGAKIAIVEHKKITLSRQQQQQQQQADQKLGEKENWAEGSLSKNVWVLHFACIAL